jgi:hypothetical protein
VTATEELHDLGQSLWLDNIRRDLLDSVAIIDTQNAALRA